MATTTKNVDTLAASGAKPDKRPTDPFVLLNEIDPDMITDVEKLKDFIYLCEAALKFLDDKIALDEAKMSNRSSTAKKLASARRYRNRRQHILNQKRKADDNKLAMIIKKKRAVSLKTRTGRDEKRYHTKGHIREGRWNGRGTSYQEWLEPANVKNSAEMRELSTEWAKPAPKTKYVVECWNKEKEKTETIDADLFVIRAGREIRKMLEAVKE